MKNINNQDAALLEKFSSWNVKYAMKVGKTAIVVAISINAMFAKKMFGTVLSALKRSTSKQIRPFPIRLAPKRTRHRLSWNAFVAGSTVKSNKEFVVIFVSLQLKTEYYTEK